METDTQNLSPAQRELVAVGASVGAGCHPCVTHHLEAAAQAGLGGEQLLAVIASAERIAAEATVLVADHARGRLEPTTTPVTLTPLEDALAAFGAALGANDAAAIDLQLRAALDLGASRSQLQQAIETAKNVQENAGRIHVGKAEQLLDSIAAPSAGETDTKPGGGCGCGSDRAAECKPPIAELFASAGTGEGAGPAAMIAHCRELFGGLFGEHGGPAKTTEAPAGTAAKGCSGKKEV